MKGIQNYNGKINKAKNERGESVCVGVDGCS